MTNIFFNKKKKTYENKVFLVNHLYQVNSYISALHIGNRCRCVDVHIYSRLLDAKIARCSNTQLFAFFFVLKNFENVISVGFIFINLIYPTN